MSVTTDATKTAQPFDDETPETVVTRRFKTTDENKSEQIVVAINNEVDEFVRDVSLRSARWRSFGQFVNDALVYYLDSDGSDVSANEVVEGSHWSYENTLTVAVTPTLFNEIEMMVEHAHTPWNSKQEFYTCALYAYINDDMPMIVGRR